MEDNLVQVVAAVKVAYGILAARCLAILSLAMTCVLFGWAMWLATPLHLLTAATFGITIFLPVLWGQRREIGDKANVS